MDLNRCWVPKSANSGVLSMPIKIGSLMRMINMLEFQAGVANVKARFQLSLDIRLDRLELLPACFRRHHVAIKCGGILLHLP